MNTHCHRYIVAGHVQGVFYRATTARKARDLGLTGHAINLDDGRVEVLACGEPAAIEELGKWLWQGSSACAVTDVSDEPLAGVSPPRVFETG